MISFLLIILTFFLSMTFYPFKSNYLSIMDRFQFGFFLLVIFLFLFFLINPSKDLSVKILFFTLAPLFLSVTFFKLYYRKIRLNEIILYIVIIFLICLILHITGNDSIRYHQSPDNHGFAATVGLIHDNFSLLSIIGDFKSVTGLDHAIHLGQVTPYLESVWNIPDTRLRYTSDMLFTVGRYGLPVYGAFLSGLKNPLFIFPHFMMALSVLGAMFVVSNLSQTLELLLKYNRQSSKYIKELFFITLVFCPFLHFYIFEGTMTQLYLLVVISFLNYILLKSVFLNEAKYKYLLLISIPSLFLVISYPNGLFLLGVISVFYLYLFCIQKRYFNFFSLLTINIIGWLIGYLLLNEALLHLIKNYLSGISGMPYHLGVHNITDLLLWQKPIEYSTYSDGTFFVRKEGTQNILFLNNLINFIFFLPIVLYVIIKLILVVNNNLKNRTHNMNLFEIIKRISYDKVFVYSFFCLSLVTISLYKYFYETSFHSYIYSRGLVVLIILCLPLNIYILLQCINKLHNKSRKFVYLISVLIFTIIAFMNAYNYYLKSNIFYNSSRQFNIIENTDTFLSINPENIIIVSDKPDHRISSLSLISKVNYLTDDWRPFFHNKYIHDNVKVYKADIVNNKIKFQYVGIIDLSDREIKGPINYKELKVLENFSHAE